MGAEGIDGFGRREFQGRFKGGLEIFGDGRGSGGEADNQRVRVEYGVGTRGEQGFDALHDGGGGQGIGGPGGQGWQAGVRADRNDEIAVHVSESERGDFGQQVAHNVGGGVRVADVCGEDVPRAHRDIGRHEQGEGESHAGELSVLVRLDAIARDFFRKTGHPFLDQSRQGGVGRQFGADEEWRDGGIAHELFQHLLHGGGERCDDFGEGRPGEVLGQGFQRDVFLRRGIFGGLRSEEIAQPRDLEESFDLLQGGQLRSGAAAEGKEDFVVRNRSEGGKDFRGARCFEPCVEEPSRCSASP